MITVFWHVEWTKQFRLLLQSGKYEDLLLIILNRSQVLLPSKKFTKNVNQSDGECDFVDNNGAKYEAKLLIDQEQGKLIGNSYNIERLNQWLSLMIQELEEYYNCSIGESQITNTRLYSIVKTQLMKLKHDENGIFFIPFPIVMDSQETIHLLFAKDFLQAIIEALQVECSKLISSRKLYFVYPSMEKNQIVLRGCGYNREYITCEELEKYIMYYAVE